MISPYQDHFFCLYLGFIDLAFWDKIKCNLDIVILVSMLTPLCSIERQVLYVDHQINISIATHLLLNSSLAILICELIRCNRNFRVYSDPASPNHRYRILFMIIRRILCSILGHSIVRCKYTRESAWAYSCPSILHTIRASEHSVVY